VTDEAVAGQEPEGEAPAETPPAPEANDIEARLTQKVDERIKGFQRLLDEKERALATARQEANDLRMSGMSDDEKAEMEWDTLQEQVSKLQAENALLQLASEYPEEMPVFRNLLTASTPKEQLEAIRALRATVAASAAPKTQENPTEGEPEIPEVDPNNPPARPATAGPVWNGQVQSEDWADRILSSVKRMRS